MQLAENISIYETSSTWKNIQGIKNAYESRILMYQVKLMILKSKGDRKLPGISCMSELSGEHSFLILLVTEMQKSSLLLAIEQNESEAHQSSVGVEKEHLVPALQSALSGKNVPFISSTE